MSAQTAPGQVADTKAQIALRIAEIRRKHVDPLHTPALDAPAAVPSSVRTRTPAAAAPAPVHFDVKFSGELLGDALASTERGSGVAVLTLVLQQSSGALPVLAVRRYDASATSHMVTHSLASRLRAGTTVRLSGKGLCVAEHDGQPALRVLDVQTVEPPAEPNTRKDLE
ncbi:MAG: hypothetical protein ABI605_11020 [Rhizobacter sp.]